MTNTLALRVSAGVGLAAIALGAFGAHALKGILDQNQSAETWKTAAFYHLTHAVLLFLLAGGQPWKRGPWLCFLVGIFIFSGSLYLLAVTDLKWLGAITPLGGLSFMAGWLWLLISPRPPGAGER